MGKAQESNNCILIVEDDTDISQMIQMVLDEIGYLTYRAKNGKEALNLLPRIPKPSLILLDLMMPVMSGWEFENKISQIPLYAKIPIIIMTAASDDSKGLKSKEFIKKPIDLDSLLPTIKHHFNRGILSETEDADFKHLIDHNLLKHE